MADAQETVQKAQVQQGRKNSRQIICWRIFGERGTITIAMEGTWAPWTYHDENGNLTGYDVEVGQLIAEKLGVEPDFVEGEWDGLLAGLDAGRYDIMINGVDVTEERQEAYDFSEAYAYNRTAVIVRGDNSDIRTMEEFGRKKHCKYHFQYLCGIGRKLRGKCNRCGRSEPDF